MDIQEETRSIKLYKEDLADILREKKILKEKEIVTWISMMGHSDAVVCSIKKIDNPVKRFLLEKVI